MRYWIPLTPTMLKLVEAAQYVDWLKIQELTPRSLKAAIHAP